MHEIDKYMTIGEACERWGLSRNTLKSRFRHVQNVNEWISKGWIKRYPVGNAHNWIISIEFMEKEYGKEC